MKLAIACDHAGYELMNKLAEMLPEYYEVRGWTDEGKPTAETLERLGVI